MRYPPSQAAIVLQEVQKTMENDEPPDLKLRRLWLTLLFMRSSSIAQDLSKMLGARVHSGPFKGMQLTPATLGGGVSPILLGCYEHELHATVEHVIADGYEKIINIGCAFGYYAIGFALRMPKVTIDAFDINTEAQKKCQEMAMLNGVADRVKIAGEFRGEDFARYADEKTLAIVDIEGAEIALLDPVRWPALQKMDFIIEMHDLMNPSISKTLLERFKATHDCEVVRNQDMLFPLQEVVGSDRFIDPFDCLIAAWEVRDGVTPWGVFRAKR